MASLTLQTDENNDLFLPDGRNLTLLTGAPACAQNILQKTLLRVTEDIYDQTNGVDYLGTVFAPQVDYDAARKSLIDAIMTVPDVVGIDSLTITINGNEFDYVAQVSTIYGQLTVASNA